LSHRQQERGPRQISGKQDLIVEGRVEGRIGLESHLTIEDRAASRPTWT